MAHKTLIGGTAYETTGGRTLIGGTGYKITGGRTLIGGTGYDVNFAPDPISIYSGGTSVNTGTLYQQVLMSAGAASLTATQAPVPSANTSTVVNMSDAGIRLTSNYAVTAYAITTAGAVTVGPFDLTNYSKICCKAYGVSSTGSGSNIFNIALGYGTTATGALTAATETGHVSAPSTNPSTVTCDISSVTGEQYIRIVGLMNNSNNGLVSYVTSIWLE